MYQVNEDNSIYVTRGDIVLMSVSAEKDGVPYTFMPGDLLRIKVYKKKKATEVALEKDFPVTEVTQKVQLYLSGEDTKIGDVISKPVDYWYEVELNPLSDPQTIIGYDEDGAKVFKLFPEGADKEVEEYKPGEEELLSRFMDDELDVTSKHPVENQVIARAFLQLEASHKATHEAVAASHVTPQMYGAVGDGVADDTEALQKAFAATKSGQTLRLPDGEYLLSKQIVITNDMSVVSVSGVIVGSSLQIDGTDVTLSGVTFRDTKANAIELINGATLTADKCRFENIGIRDDLDETSQGCGIYAGGEFEIRVYNSVFDKCHGHGAIFCGGAGKVDVKGCYFRENYYRAIQLYGEGVTSGTIFGNYIEDCGKHNQTGSGVGCNGVYSTNGSGVVLEGNTIMNSRENAVEGAFLRVVGNYINGTGVEIETKPTPSNEGIFVVPSVPAFVADNIILNAGGYGIKSYSDTAITQPIYIKGNIIRGSGSGAIDINSPESVSNVFVIDNTVDGDVNLNNANDTDVYVGDISKLNGKPDISRNKAILDYYHYFDQVSPFTSSNCTPTISTDSDGASYANIPYQEYAKLTYALPSLKSVKHLLYIAVCGKGKFTVNITKNNQYYRNVLAIEGTEFVEKHYIMPLTGAISDKFKVTIELQETSGIKTMDVRLYR